MRRSQLMLALMILFLLVTAATCAKKKSTEKLQDFGFVGGTEGVLVSFVEGNPPSGIFSRDPFLISVQLENKGETDIADGQVISTLEGISYRSYSIQQPTLTNEIPIDKVRIDRQSGDRISGGIEQINYEAEFVDEIDFDATHTLSVNVCYLYQTKSVSSLCLVNNPTQRPKETDVCLINEVKGVGNSGSPLQITQLSQRASGKSEITFNFQVENKGPGKVYHPSFADVSEPKCTNSGNENQLDKVRVTVIPPEDLVISCPKLGEGNSGEVRLIKGSSTIVCSIDTSRILQDAPFPGEVKIQVDFIYKEHISQPITVESVA